MANKQQMKIVPPRSARAGRERTDLVKLKSMVSFAMIFATLSVMGFLLLEDRAYISIATAEFAGFSLWALVIYGLLPLLISTVCILIFRAEKSDILGTRPSLEQFLVAPITGFLFGLLIWTTVQLVQSLTLLGETWIRIPGLWQKASLYLGLSPAMGLLTVMVAAVVPATSQELLFRGVILPHYSVERPRALRIFLPALLAAMLSGDLHGLLVLLAMALVSSWIRIASDSLYLSSLATLGMSFSMLFARGLFSWITQILFQMPLVDHLRVRIFYVTFALVLIVLLIAPVSVMDAKSPRRDPMARKKSRNQGTLSPVNRIVAILSIAAMAVFYYFVF